MRARVDLMAQPEAQLARLLAGTEAERQRNQRLITDLAEGVDAGALQARLEVERLLGILGPRLPDMPNVAGVRRDAHQVAERAARDGTVMELLAESVLACLRSASIPATALKGPSLSRALYGNPGLRASVDVDVLVAADNLVPAVEALESIGYGAPQDHLDARGLPQLHLTLQPPPGLVAVELHWRIHWYETRFASELARLDELPLVRRLAVELAALLCFYARDGFTGLRLATDIAAWWDLHHSEHAPDAFAEVLEQYPELRRAIVTAAAVANDVVGLPFDRIVERATDRQHVSRLVVRHANWSGHGSVQQMTAQTALFDVVLAPDGARRRAARRQLVAPPEKLRVAPGVGLRSERAVRVHQLLHPFRTMARFVVVFLPTSPRLIRGSAGSSRAERASSP